MTQKWVVSLLVGVLALQGWMLSRQTQLDRKLNQTQMQLQDLSRSFPQQLGSLQAQMQARDALPAWLSAPKVEVTPQPECRDTEVKIAWSLTDWTPGTKAHLQYRRGTGEDWHEAAVRDLGQQSYDAVFPLTGGPGLLWKVALGKEQPAGQATSPRITYYPPEAVQYRSGAPAMPAYQYRIVVDVPGGSRATAPQSLTLSPDLVASAGFNVTVGQGGGYSVTAAVDPAPRNTCVQVKSVAARPFAGEKQSGEYLLAPSGQSGMLQAAWKGTPDLTRIDLVVRYGILESVIPVDLTGVR